MDDSHVIDASVVIAALLGEVGEMAAEAVLRAGGVMSAANASEVVARMLREGLEFGPASAAIDGLDILVLPLDRRAAHEIARLEPTTRHLGLNMADRACIHAGQVTGLPIATADRAWSKLDAASLGVEIRLLR